MAAYTLFLYATLTIAYDIFMFYSNRIGPDSVSSRMNLAFVPVGVILLLFIIFSLPRVWGVYLYKRFKTYRSLLSEANGSRLKRAGKNRLFGGWIVRITGRACPEVVRE